MKEIDILKFIVQLRADTTYKQTQTSCSLTIESER